MKGYGIVRGPVGEFAAFYLLSTTGGLFGQTGARLLEAWYSPQVRAHVKRVVYQETGWVILELVSFSSGQTR